jgi:hypothetical protein
MKITIKKALQLKSKLIANNKELFVNISKYNSYIQGQTPPYNSLELFEKWSTGVRKLVELKTLINTANQPVYEKIFELSETRAMIANIKSLACKTGTSTNSNYLSAVSETYESTIGVLDRDAHVERLIKGLDKLQDELDYHNSTTYIEVEDDFFN